MSAQGSAKSPLPSPENAGDRLVDLFCEAEKLPSLGEWRVCFETTIQTVMRIRELSRPAAEKAAYQNILVDFLNDSMPADCDPNICLWCRRVEEPGAVLVPLGVGRRTAWLHREGCADQWRDHRRADAVAKLAAMGIVRP